MISAIQTITSLHDYLYIYGAFSSPNVFLILKNTTYEIRNSNFIAWVLDPKESHCQGDLFLCKFLESINITDFGPLEEVQLKREFQNIDLIIYNKDNVIVIENKTKSTDFQGQLSRYRSTIEKFYPSRRRIFIYWRLAGDLPVDENERLHWDMFSYEQFVEILQSALPLVVNSKVHEIISDYIKSVKLNILVFSEYEKRAQNLWKTHRNELLFIIQNRQLLRDLSRPHLDTLTYIEKYTPIIRGIGFFGSEFPYASIFVRECSKRNYSIKPQKSYQSTYLSFTTTVIDELFQPQENINHGISFYFRHQEKQGKFNLTFGVGPETIFNGEIRRRIITNKNIFANFGIGKLVKSRGLNHIGILSLSISIDPSLLYSDKIQYNIEKLFKNYVDEFVDSVHSALLKIMD